jgi:hypothetical protein
MAIFFLKKLFLRRRKRGATVSHRLRELKHVCALESAGGKLTEKATPSACWNNKQTDREAEEKTKWKKGRA